jgi:diguanylate cyclase (GGDEF)-like protein
MPFCLCHNRYGSRVFNEIRVVLDIFCDVNDLNVCPGPPPKNGRLRPFNLQPMSENPGSNGNEMLKRIADKAGVAIAIVDRNGRQILAANNNSICRNLNPGKEFSPECAKYCGRAFEETRKAAGTISYVCHAGLDCRAVPAGNAERPLVAIVGRTFLKSENYRKATERAIIGDWRHFPPSDFFENILLTGSEAVLDNATREVGTLLSPTETGPQPQVEQELQTLEADARETQTVEPAAPAPATKPAEKRTADMSAWRSFFGSILKNDHPRAVASILKFLAQHYGFAELMWLEKREGRFEHTAGYSKKRGRKVRLGLLPDDPRLVDAFHHEMPFTLGERSDKPDAHTLTLFPLGVDGEISAAIGVLDPIDSDDTKRHVARVCHSVAPQLEILRLRTEASRREAIARAVRIFGESLKNIDDADLWQNVTQKTAEILRAERASLLMFDENKGCFEIKALVGASEQPDDDGQAGSRVARIVFARNEAVIVADVAKTGLPAAPAERNYRTSSFLSCPIHIGSRTIGVMSFTDRASGEAFDVKSLELFQAIAPQLAVAIDHAVLKERAGEFEQLSVTDALTGLLNRRYIEARLAEEIKRSNRHGFPMSFMMLDVDHFKSYNDEFGHPAGDDALKTVGHVIRETLRGADVAARFGGEEFSILLPQTTAEEAAAIAERIRTNLEETQFPHRRVTASIGIASCSAELCASSDLVSAADKALYEAKRRGRNRVLTFETLNGVPV